MLYCIPAKYLDGSQFALCKGEINMILPSGLCGEVFIAGSPFVVLS